MWNLRGDDEKEQGLRSLTPEGFAYAFALANRPGTEARAADAPAGSADAPAAVDAPAARSGEAVLHASPAGASRREKSQAATRLLDEAAKPGQLHSVRPFPDEEADYHRFLYTARDGETKVAGKYTYENGEIDNLDIGDTNNPVDLGAGDVRAMIKQLRELHPETTKLSAYRMTGARAATGEGPEFVSFTFKPKATAEEPAGAPAPPAAKPKLGELMSSSAAPALDLGARVDPGQVARDRQLVDLKAAAPLRASNDVDQQGEIGLELFDAVDQPTLSFRLDEEGDEISGADLLAELEADDKAIATLRGCL
jgi:hypothetical protein